MKELEMTSQRPVRLLTPKEAADFLSVSPRTIKRLVSEGDLTAVRVRNSMRFRLQDLEIYIERSRWSWCAFLTVTLWPDMASSVPQIPTIVKYYMLLSSPLNVPYIHYMLCLCWFGFTCHLMSLIVFHATFAELNYEQPKPLFRPMLD